MPRKLPISRLALTLVEVVASTMIVGMLAVATLNSLGAATKSSISIGHRAVAQGLADELLAEIQLQAYRDAVSPTFGLEAGETVGLRSTFDDIDDYYNYNQSPPKYRDGSPIPDRTNWRQRVEIGYVSPSDPTQTSATDQGGKRIRVAIEYDNQVLAEQTAIRANTD